MQRNKLFFDRIIFKNHCTIKHLQYILKESSALENAFCVISISKFNRQKMTVPMYYLKDGLNGNKTSFDQGNLLFPTKYVCCVVAIRKGWLGFHNWAYVT